MKNIKSITEDEYMLRFPNGNQDYFNNLSNLQKTNYLIVLSTYYYWLNNYVNELIGLKEYDDYLRLSESNFRKVPDNDMDFYQRMSQTLLSYIYVRNNVYIEKLSSQDILFIANKIKNNDLQYTDEVERFIESTYQKVILEPGVDKNINTNFGPLSEKFLVKNGSLIIGVRYDDLYKEDIKSEDIWKIEYKQREEEIGFMIDLLNARISNLGLLAKTIKYDDFSVKKKEVNDMFKSQNKFM